jgi:hypothetical protein
MDTTQKRGSKAVHVVQRAHGEYVWIQTSVAAANLCHSLVHMPAVRASNAQRPQQRIHAVVASTVCTTPMRFHHRLFLLAW